MKFKRRFGARSGCDLLFRFRRFVRRASRLDGDDRGVAVPHLGAPLAAKLAVPAALVALACYAPFAVNSMLGFPVSAGLYALPDRAELVAFFPHDEEGLVDLWLSVGASAGLAPRAYLTDLGASMKETLRRARERHRNGQTPLLAKRGKGPSTSSGQALHSRRPPGISD